jgi:hypothetical protein
MVQTADPRHRNHPTTCARNSNGLAPCWGLLLQPEVCPVLVVVADVFPHQALQMPFVYYDDMIQQVPPAVADEALGDPILPRAAKLVRLGSIPKLLMVLTTSMLKLAARSKIRYFAVGL